MRATIVVDLQWGDSGKAAVVDKLSASYVSWNYVCRATGGSNAGHTVNIEDTVYKLHLIPAGIFNKHKCVLGNGMVINPDKLEKEIKYLEKEGFSVRDRLFISKNAHVVTDKHIEIDQAYGKEIGTTGQGIGPAYVSKAHRLGHRIGDFLAKDHPLYKNLVNLYELLRGNILVEGAQGTLLDLDHGTYPYVTSSNCTVAGCCNGLGIAPRDIENTIGVFKAYTTRVGNGPFPSEIADKKLAEQIQTIGNEFGTTTGRIRRVGWLDWPLLEYAAKLNGINEVVITKFDVISKLPIIGVRTKAAKNIFESHPQDQYKFFTDPFSYLAWIKDRLKYDTGLRSIKIDHIRVGPERKQVYYP